MKRILAAVTILGLSACAQETAPQSVETAPPALDAAPLPITDQAGNRMEAMNAIGERFCSAGGPWCVNAQANGLVASHGNVSTSITWPAGENQTSRPWPNLIVSGDTAFVGAVITEEQMYSGGSGRVDHLVLYEVSNGAAREALRIPLAGEISIRACFDEDDVQARAEACLDEYAFVSSVRIDDTVADGPPVIVLETAAATYPGRISRTQDSAARGPLTQADLVWAADDVCSYRRTFSRGAAGAYAPDTALPACADYLEP